MYKTNTGKLHKPARRQTNQPGPLRTNSKVPLLLSAGATSLSSHQGAGRPTPQCKERLQALYLMFYLSCFLSMKLHFKICLTNTYGTVPILFWIPLRADTRT